MLVQVLDQYLADLQMGRAPDKQALLARHPGLAKQLEDCLAGIEFVHRAAAPAAGMPAVLGDFRIVREVGRGGMGVVYEAEQLSLKRKVALKVLRAELTEDTEFLQQFRREMPTAAGLTNPHVVPVHNYGEIGDQMYVEMRLIDGCNLGRLIRNEGERLLPARAVAIPTRRGSAGSPA